MKKMLAFFTAAICCLGMLTACGNSESSNNSDSQASDKAATSSAASESEEPARENSGDEYTEVFRTFFIGKDPIQMLEVSLPDVVIESMEKIGAVESISEALATAAAQSMSAVPVMDAGMIEYVSERECTPEFRSRLENLYSAYYNIYRTMDESGISYEEYITGNLDENSMKLLSDVLDRYERVCAGEETEAEQLISFEDVRLVTFSMNGGQTEFLMYKVSGEGWKLDTIGLAVFEY